MNEHHVKTKGPYKITLDSAFADQSRGITLYMETFLQLTMSPLVHEKMNAGLSDKQIKQTEDNPGPIGSCPRHPPELTPLPRHGTWGERWIYFVESDVPHGAICPRARGTAWRGPTLRQHLSHTPIHFRQTHQAELTTGMVRR